MARKAKSSRRRTSKPIRFQVYRLKGSPAAFLGTVYAADPDSAVALAIKQLNITNPEHEKRLLIRKG